MNQNNGSLIIKLNKKKYQQGDLIKGFILLNFIKPTHSGKLFLEIKGKEKTQWKEQNGRNPKTHSSKYLFFSRKAVAHQFYEQIEKGEHTFPFELQLSPNMPGSLDCNESFLATITYIIKALFISSFDTMLDMKYKQKIIVNEPNKLLLQPQIMQSSAKIYTWYCMDQGISSIWARTQKNYYYPGETVKVFFDIDNQFCNVHIQNIEISLVNKIEVKFDDGFQKIFIQEYNVKTFEGLQKRTKIMPDQQRECEIQIINLNQQDKNLNPSINGKLIRSTYFIKIQPNYSSCICCSGRYQTPILFIPITIILDENLFEENFFMNDDLSGKCYETLKILNNKNSSINSNKKICHMIQPMSE